MEEKFEFESQDSFTIHKRTCYAVPLWCDCDRDELKYLSNKEVLVNGTKYTCKGIESFALLHLRKGMTISLAVEPVPNPYVPPENTLGRLVEKHGFGVKFRYLNRPSDWWFMPAWQGPHHEYVGPQSDSKRIEVWGTEGDVVGWELFVEPKEGADG